MGPGTGEGGIGSDDAREVAGRRIVVVEKCGVAAVADVRSVHIERRVDLEAAVRPAGADALHLVLRPWCAEKVAGIEQRIKRQGRGAIRIGGVFVDDAKYGHIESYPCIDDHGIRLEHIQGNEIAVNGRPRCNRAGIGGAGAVTCESPLVVMMSAEAVRVAAAAAQMPSALANTNPAATRLDLLDMNHCSEGSDSFGSRLIFWTGRYLIFLDNRSGVAICALMWLQMVQVYFFGQQKRRCELRVVRL
jgi:hypothetical protein